MKITFLCSGAEPGQDGVGDYTRALASQLEQGGCETQIIALNDRFAASEGTGRRLRLHPRISWQRRTEVAADAVRSFDPDWVSLQFVAYGFHPKGLCLQAARRLRTIIGARRTHVMLHELWIGEATEYGGKDRLIGAMQKRIVLGLLSRLKPALIHTSNPVFHTLLERHGVGACELPLFGSIPISPNRRADWLFEKSGEQGCPIDSASRSHFLLLGLFGTIHPQWSGDRLLAALSRDAGGKKLVLVSIGRIGRAGAEILRKTQDARGVSCIHLGEQPAERISDFLQTVDLGVATSPWALIGKSATVAAMLDHGLPVVVTRDDWKLRSGPTPEPAPHPLLFKLDERFSAALRAGLPRRAMKSSLPVIATDFLASMGDPSTRELGIAA